MDSVELVKRICAERKIPISKLEKDCNFSNGYIRKLKEGKFPSDRLLTISKYLNLSIPYLMTGEESSDEIVELTAKDNRDIARDLDRIMGEIRKGNDGPLYYNGVEISDASINLLQNAIEFALKETKKENKVKYNPNKNQK